MNILLKINQIQINLKFLLLLTKMHTYIGIDKINDIQKLQNMAKNQENIPLKQPREENSSSHSSAVYSDNIQSENYVGQFLDFTSYQKNVPLDQIGPHNIGKTLQTTINTPPSSNDYRKESFESGQKMKSTFHNFQKHLVTTLRHCIDIQSMHFTEQTKQIADILWNFFLKCPKMTRTLIYLVYGGINMESSKAKKFNRQYGLQKLIKNKSYQNIKDVQKILRTESLRQIQKIQFQEEMQHRRIKNKKGFSIYFQTFIQQLKGGGFNKRLPKQKRQKVEHKNKLQLKQDFQGLSSNKA